MKILINVSQKEFRNLTEDWIAVEGIRLEENHDGSFELLCTRNLETTRATQANLEALTAKIVKDSNA